MAVFLFVNECVYLSFYILRFHLFIKIYRTRVGSLSVTDYKRVFSFSG